MRVATTGGVRLGRRLGEIAYHLDGAMSPKKLFIGLETAWFRSPERLVLGTGDRCDDQAFRKA